MKILMLRLFLVSCGLVMFYITNFEKQYLDHPLMNVFVIVMMICMFFLLYYTQKSIKKNKNHLDD